MDQEAEIIQNLRLPIKSFRLFALQESIQIGASQTLLAALKQRETEEDDDECRHLLSYAINAVEQHLNATPPAVIKEDSPEAFITLWKASDSKERMQLISNIQQNMVSQIASTAPELFESEKDFIVAATILKKFSRNWPDERLSFLVLRLSSPSYFIRFAALELLVQRAPKSLIDYLPKLLIADDPRIKLLAVRGLAAIDMDEALAHLEALLFSPDKHIKLSIFQSFFYLPFENIKPILFKFFALENNAAILEKVGQLFLINPDPEVPYKIWEISETSAPDKAKVLKKILQGACRVIEMSRILKDNFNDYMTCLKEWIYKRNAFRMVQETVAYMAEGTDASSLVELEIKLKKGFKNPVVREAFEEALSWRIPDQVKEQLKAWLFPDANTTLEKTTIVAKAPENFGDLSLEEKIRRVALLDTSNVEQAQQLLDTIFSDQKTSIDLMAISLRTALSLGISTYIQVAEKNLMASEPKLTAAAIEYIGQFDPDRIFPIIGKFFQSQNNRIKSAAIKVLKKFDPPQAVSMLSTMLSAKDPQKHLLALASMVHFDFALVRTTLANFLMKTQTKELFESGISFFQANPDLENLFQLYRIEKSVIPDFGIKVKIIRENNIQLLGKMGLLKEAEIAKQDAKNAEKWAKEQAEKKVAPAPYSLRAIQKPKSRWMQFSQCLIDSLKNLKEGLPLGARMVFISFIIIGTIFLRLITSGSESSNPNAPQGKALVSDPLLIVGIVQGKAEDSGVLILQTEDGTKFRIIQEKGEFETLQISDKVKITVVPFRSTLDGTILCNHQGFEKL